MVEAGLEHQHRNSVGFKFSTNDRWWWRVEDKALCESFGTFAWLQKPLGCLRNLKKVNVAREKMNERENGREQDCKVRQESDYLRTWKPGYSILISF